jgi:hypothetical protein
MSSQPDAAALAERPNCALCGKPAGWQKVVKRWGRYCGGYQCYAIYRRCKNCGQEFFTGRDGLRLYCSTDCQKELRRHGANPGPVVTCPVDGQKHQGHNRWGLCGDCWLVIMPIRHRLDSHKVPTHMVVDLIKHPFCPIPACGRPLLTYEPGMKRLPLVIDHDHNHCPGPIGCELCIRGLICFQCNLGMPFGMKPEVLDGRAAYLRAWESR